MKIKEKSFVDFGKKRKEKKKLQGNNCKITTTVTTSFSSVHTQIII